MRLPRRVSVGVLLLAASTLACGRGDLTFGPPETAAPSVHPGESTQPQTAVADAYHAGLRIEQTEYVTPGGRTELLTMAVWYPTQDEERPFSYEMEETYTSHVAVEAQPADSGEPFPLVVYAHGAFSSGYSLAFLGEHLARNGYVVVAPDYIDTVLPDFTEPMAFSRILTGPADPPIRVFAAARQWVEVMNADPELLLAYLAEHRLGQTTFVLDQALAWNADPDSIFFQRIDPDRIGIIGWSLGGSTALGLIGAHPDPAIRDSRIKAALLLSAPPYPFQESLVQIVVPIMQMEGDDDPPNAGPEYPRRLVYDAAPPPKYHLVLDDTTHYDFGNRPAGSLPLDEAIDKVPGLNAIAEYGMAFFDLYVREDPAAAARLNAGHPALDVYEEEE